MGGYLLGLWGLPVPIVEAIAFHHRPSSAMENRFSPLTAVHAANALVQLTSEVDIPYLTALGLASRVPEWRANLQKTTPTEAAA